MSALGLRLTALAGSGVEDAMCDAVNVANKVEITVLVNVNGVECLVFPKADPNALLTNWKQALQDGTKFCRS